MNVLIVGYGSIGKRHHEIFSNLGCRVGIVSSRFQVEASDRFQTLQSALQACSWNLLVISNRTSEHFATLNDLLRRKFIGCVLVEKPLFNTLMDVGSVPTDRIFVSYNLRFHPAVQKLSRLLQKENIISAQFYVGQYLPTWRPDRNYLDSYSASKSLGGGVLRDLSHELDLMHMLAGKWVSVAAIGGTYSQLGIDSDDMFSLLVQTERCPAVSVQLNYLDRIVQRKIVVNTDQHTYSVDLIRNRINFDGAVQSFEVDRNTTYINQHRRLIQGEYDGICTYAEGLEVMKLIDAAEQAADRKVWIPNDAMHDLR